jgi:hypothetical protein
VVLEELFQPRRKAFARLDTNGDGRLSFEEWAVRTSKRFSEADRDRNGALTRANSRPPHRAAAPRRGPSRAAAAEGASAGAGCRELGKPVIDHLREAFRVRHRPQMSDIPDLEALAPDAVRSREGRNGEAGARLAGPSRRWSAGRCAAGRRR